MGSVELHPIFWHWLVIGVGLLAVEAFFPGAIFLWMGVAAIAVGGIVYLWPALGWEGQVFLFAVLSIVAIVAWRIYHRKNPTATTQPLLNRRGRQYVGRTFTLTEPIVNGDGKITVDDSTWKVRGTDCPAGTSVEVTDVDGVVLKVEPRGGRTRPQ